MQNFAEERYSLKYVDKTSSKTNLAKVDVQPAQKALEKESQSMGKKQRERKWKKTKVDFKIVTGEGSKKGLKKPNVFSCKMIQNK